MTRPPLAFGRRLDACGAFAGAAALLVGAIVAALLVWAVYAVSFAVLGAIDHPSHQSIQVDSTGPRR